MSIRALTLASLLAFALPSFAHDYTVGSIKINHPWSRELPPNAPAGAAFFALHNQGKEADRLLGASTPRAGHSELHTHTHADGVMKMSKVENVEVPANGDVTFQPGGLHVMLFDLKEPLKAGDKFPLTLKFEKAGEVEVSVQVEAMAAAPAAMPMMNHDGKHKGH